MLNHLHLHLRTLFGLHADDYLKRRFFLNFVTDGVARRQGTSLNLGIMGEDRLRFLWVQYYAPNFSGHYLSYKIKDMGGKVSIYHLYRDNLFCR